MSFFPGSILRVDLSGGRIAREELSAGWELLGGRALSSAILAAEVDPRCDPLGPDNKLILAPGLLASGLASSAGRLSAGAKSPLTGTAKESNGGGMTAGRLARAGIRALIVEGQVPRGGLAYLVIDGGESGEARLEDAAALRGLGAYAAAALLRGKYGPRAGLALVGPTAEAGFGSAGIANTDFEGAPSRYSARGGLGAVMGRKGLKAVVILGGRGGSSADLTAADPDTWNPALKTYRKLLSTLPTTAERYPRWGTASMLANMDVRGGLPTRNFSAGSFEGTSRVDHFALDALVKERGGRGTMTHACMSGCMVRCSNRVPDTDGEVLVSPLEYENMALLGPNFGLADLDGICRLNRACNDLGLDAIEAGVALGVAAEGGLLDFGDAGRALALLESLAAARPQAPYLGEGAVATGEALGVKRIPVVKGQSIPGYDPRVIKGNGVTYSTSPMGADHTAGNLVGATLDPAKHAEIVKASRESQIRAAMMDCLGLCNFTVAAVMADPEVTAALVSGSLGRTVTVEELQEAGKAAIRAELDFNRRAGFGAGDDRLPEFFRKEPLPPTGEVWDLPDEMLDGIWEDL
ncbi:MAG: aldehyde ferredoxin oxidoreductase [Firmicutes bacterium]|nr:aldehyde ferredoxin oxidoreductase [Bacillota bacterium]